MDQNVGSAAAPLPVQAIVMLRLSVLVTVDAHVSAICTKLGVRIGFSRGYVPLAVYEGLVTRLGGHLTPNELARLKAEGAYLTPETAIALARTTESSTAT